VRTAFEASEMLAFLWAVRLNRSVLRKNSVWLRRDVYIPLA
jgi:hypothetical protein